MATPQFTSLVMFFNGGNQGWSETYWNISTNVGNLVNLNGAALVAARSKFLSNRCAIVGYVARRYPSEGRIAAPAIGPGSIGQIGLPVNEMEDCALFKLSTSTSHVRNLFCHGIPDEWIASSGFTPAGLAALSTAASDFIDQLSAVDPRGWGIRERAPSLTTPILTATLLAGGTVISLLVGNATGYAVGDQILVQRYKPNPLLNGTWKILALSGNTIQLAMATASLGVGSGAASGTISKLGYTLELQNLARISGADSKRVGRPFFLTRGRAISRVHHR